MSKHTPGTWAIGRYSNYIGFAIFAPNRGCIAERWYDADQESPYGDEIIANARLIAAAPDMFNALKAIEFALAIPGTTTQEVLDENSPIRGAIREAITKAEGEAQ